MTDIVERLRDTLYFIPDRDLGNQAADEIERLRALQATPDQPVTTEMSAKLANLASGCRVKADLYAKVDPTIPASFTWVANEIDHILASASHRSRSAP